MVRRNDELMKIAGNEVKTLPELALRYLLSFNEVSTVIPGMRRVKNVEANTSLSDGIKLSERLMNELKKHKWERNFYPESWKDAALKDTGYLEE